MFMEQAGQVLALGTMDAGVMAGFGMMHGSMLSIAAILQIVGMALVFRKADEGWWKAIIPIYDIYIQAKIGKAPLSWFWIVLAAIVGGTFLSIVGAVIAGAVSPGIFGLLVMFVGIVVILVGAAFSIMISYRLVLAFGKGVGFLIGLIFLPTFFWLILGLDSSEYQPAETSA